METVFIGLAAGLGLASVYVLIALAFTAVLAASGVFNFAQPSITMGTTIGVFFLTSLFHVPTVIVILLSLLSGAIAGWIIYFISVQPVVHRSRNITETTLLTTFGVGIAVNAFAALEFGSNPRAVASYVTSSPLFVVGIPVQPIYVVMIVIAALVVILTEIVTRRTQIGIVFRCTLEDPEGAQLVGIGVSKVVTTTFVIAGVLSGAAGYLIAPVISASAYSAQTLAFYGFAAIAIGGFGSFTGTLVGGLIVGLISGIVPAIFSSEYINPILWLLILVILLFKPAGLWGAAGLFGSSAAREV